MADVTLMANASPLILELKIGLVVVVLARSLLDFIWAIRQMNYSLAVIGAAPEPGVDTGYLARYGEAAANILNPALSAFNAGVRGYYFALAAAAWLLGPGPFAVATLGAVLLLIWRQSKSRASAGVHAVTQLLAEEELSRQAKLRTELAGEFAGDDGVRLP